MKVILHGGDTRVTMPRISRQEAVALYRAERKKRARRLREAALLEEARAEYLGLQITNAISGDRLIMDSATLKKRAPRGSRPCAVCNRPFHSTYPNTITCSASCRNKRAVAAKRLYNQKRTAGRHQLGGVVLPGASPLNGPNEAISLGVRNAAHTPNEAA